MEFESTRDNDARNSTPSQEDDVVFLGMHVGTDALVEFGGNTTSAHGTIDNPIYIDEESNEDDADLEKDDSDSSGLDPSLETEYMALSSYTTSSSNATSASDASDDDST